MYVDHQVLGELEFGFYHQWFDTIFIASSLTTLTIKIAAVFEKTLSLMEKEEPPVPIQMQMRR